MSRKQLAFLAAPIAAWLVSSCASMPSDAYVVQDDPGTVEHVEGSDLGTVHLADGAEQRLRLATTVVSRNGKHLVVPDSAIFVDPDGIWWVYTNPDRGVFVRHEIGLVRQHDGRALLSSGPEVGTHVVTVGVAELYGIEAEVGH